MWKEGRTPLFIFASNKKKRFKKRQELAHLFASNVFSLALVTIITMLMALLTCPCLWKAGQDDCFVVADGDVVVGVVSDEGLM